MITIIQILYYIFEQSQCGIQSTCEILIYVFKSLYRVIVIKLFQRICSTIDKLTIGVLLGYEKDNVTYIASAAKCDIRKEDQLKENVSNLEQVLSAGKF